jgi:hypothetical protein
MIEGKEKNDSPALAHFGHMGEEVPSIVGGDGFSSQPYCVNAGHGNERILGTVRENLGTSQYVS